MQNLPYLLPLPNCYPPFLLQISAILERCLWLLLYLRLCINCAGCCIIEQIYCWWSGCLTTWVVWRLWCRFGQYHQMRIWQKMMTQMIDNWGWAALFGINSFSIHFGTHHFAVPLFDVSARGVRDLALRIGQEDKQTHSRTRWPLIIFWQQFDCRK